MSTAMAKAIEQLENSYRPTKANLLRLYKRRNFLVVHYAYILTFCILGSIILFAAGRKLAYVDILFFSTCAATQGGLNTTDINTIGLARQIILSIISHLTNPIIINTFVVMIRIYYFDKDISDYAKKKRAAKERARKKANESKVRKNPGLAAKTMTSLRRVLSVHPDRSSQGLDVETGGDGPTGGNIFTNHAFGDNGMESSQPHGGLVGPGHRRRPSADDGLPSIAENFDAGDPVEVAAPTDGNDDGNDGRPSLDSTMTDNASVSNPKQRRGNTDPGNNSNPSHYDRAWFMELQTWKERVRAFIPWKRGDGADDDGLGEKTKPYPMKFKTQGNSRFPGLTQDELKEIGEIEYRSLIRLRSILVFYLVAFNLLGVVVFVPWIYLTDKYRVIVLESDSNPGWWAMFTVGSMFNDVGFTLTADGMLSFQKSKLTLLFGSFLIIVGNTGFPCMLRLMIWIQTWFKNSKEKAEELQFLLLHPRRCFTLLFPSRATWWLFFVLVMLNGLDVALFMILDINNASLAGLSVGDKLSVGLFQVASTRTAGFSAVAVAALHPAVQVSYMVLMYISIFPIAISIRRTNVYEEQSLGAPAQTNAEPNIGSRSQMSLSMNHPNEGSTATFQQPGRDSIGARSAVTGIEPARPVDEKSVYGGQVDVTGSNEVNPRDREAEHEVAQDHPSVLAEHLRRQLSHDIWYVFAGLFLLCLTEGGKIQDESAPGMTIFAILFEVVSAYGTVGMSLGYPDFNPSLSGKFSTVGKLVIIAMLIRGRHRGLPHAIDRAVMPRVKEDSEGRALARSKNKLKGTAGFSTSRMSFSAMSQQEELRRRNTTLTVPGDRESVSAAPPRRASEADGDGGRREGDGHIQFDV